MSKLAGRVAVITGAGSGIGRATALLFAGEGARVCLLDLSLETCSETAKMVGQSGGESLALRCDVSDEAEVISSVRRSIEHFGRIDVLVNNAAIELALPATETTVEDWERVQAVNLRGVFLCSKQAIPEMRRAQGGSIVNVASANALVGVPKHAAYSAAKGGVVALTRQLALDYGREGIRVNCVCPTTTDTPMVRAVTDEVALQAIVDRHPLPRLCRAEDVANAVLFLASDDARCVTGVILPVDCGWTAQ